MSYEGKRVIVTGGGGTGMGAAAARQLVSLGAEVHVLDMREPETEVASHRAVDLTDPEAMDVAVQEIGGSIDALFNCVGVPGPPFVTEVLTMLVNFVGVRHLTELVTERMGEGGAIATITSAAAVGWQDKVDTFVPLLETNGFEEARAWCEANPEAIATGYGPSKEAATIWTMYACNDLGARGIRINCTWPGPTETPMWPEFKRKVRDDFWDEYPIPLGRFQTPDEQAAPLVFLNSSAASGITGSIVVCDGGSLGAAATGRVQLPDVHKNRPQAG